MCHYKNVYIAIVLLISAALAVCNTSIKQSKQKGVSLEGYIFINFEMFNDIDARGVPINAAEKNDSIFLSGKRKMYLYRDLLIDIVPNKNFVNGEYTMTDTLSFDFYDLTYQKFIYFDKFSVDAKILKRGKMSEGGSFSKMPEVDPMNEVPDSIWKVTDTIINGKTIGVVTFIYPDTTDSLGIEFAKRAKFWVDYSLKDFPLQMSYILSNKLNGGFVYRMQNPAPDGKAVLVTTLTYDQVKFPDSLVRILISGLKLQENRFQKIYLG